MMFLTSLVVGQFVHAQVTTVQVNSQLPNYGVCNVLYYKAPSTVLAPKTVVFVPGLGQHQSPGTRDGTKDLLDVEGPLPFIQKGWRPDYNVIVLQPSYTGYKAISNDGALVPDTELRYYEFVRNLLSYLVNPEPHADFPKVTRDKIYLTGLSLGAHYIHSYVKHHTSEDMRPQAMVTMSIAMPQTLTGYDNFRNIPAWAFIGANDVDVVKEDIELMKGTSFYGTMSGFWSLMKGDGWSNKRLTVYEGTHQGTVSADGHKGWQYFYNPQNKFPEQTVPALILEQQPLSAEPSIYEWMLSYPNLTTLPVLFQSFKVQYITTETILQWATSSESDNAYFVVERSEDGIHYKEVGRVPSKAPGGQSSSLLNYIFKLINK